MSRLRPVTLREANALVAAHHRHSSPVRGCVCCVGLDDAGQLVAAAIVGRPVARALADGWTAEVTRLVVAGHVPNACSELYGAAWRAVRALGYRRLVTYTLESESGVSLRAAGFVVVDRSTRSTRANGWAARADVPGQLSLAPPAARDRQPARLRWEKVAA